MVASARQGLVAEATPCVPTDYVATDTKKGNHYKLTAFEVQAHSLDLPSPASNILHSSISRRQLTSLD